MADSIKVHVRHLGNTRVDVMNIMPPEKKSRNPLAWTGLFRPKKYQRIIPCTTYVIEHPKGILVFDTGFNKTVRKYPLLDLTFVHNQINKPLQNKGDAVDEVLANMGIRPEDIEYVLLSHMHSDHAHGAKQLIGAKHFLVSKEEMDKVEDGSLGSKVTYVKRWRKGLPIETFEFENTGVGPVGLSYDLFGDGSVQLVKMPGHTPGMFGVLVENNGKKLIMAGDCGYTRESYLDCVVPSVVSDVEAFKSSLNWMKDEYYKDDVVDVLVNHDATVPDQTFVL